MNSEVETDAAHCSECGAGIQLATAHRTGGFCLPCKRKEERALNPWLRWLRFALPLLALLCMALVGTIEVLNYKSGDAIARKMAQEPHSQWRIIGPRSAWLSYQRDFQIGKGLNPAEPLAAGDQSAFQAYARSRWQAQLPRHWLSLAMKYCIWVIPAGLFTGVGSFILVAGIRPCWRGILWTSGIVGTMAFVTVAVRYVPTLGW